MDWNQVKQIAVLVFYCSWLGFQPWSPRVSRTLLLITNFATALCVTVLQVFPLRDFLEDWRWQAIVAFEVVAAVSAVAAFLRKRPALFVSYLVFAVHLGVIVWFFTHPLHFERMNVLDYG